MVTGNLWDRFNKLTSNAPKQIATVVAMDSGVVTVEYLGGSVADILDSGSYEIDKRVFVQGNEIKGQAPDLTYFEVEV